MSKIKTSIRVKLRPQVSALWVQPLDTYFSAIALETTRLRVQMTNRLRTQMTTRLTD
ncbi:MAG: hypothetical protein R3E79_45075 [Caldilineaceae bacterium]